MNIKCEKLDNYGNGLLRIDKKVITHKDALIGELFSYGKELTRISDAKERVKPFCKAYLSCGGCQIQHMNYTYQLEYKRNIILNYFKQHNINTLVHQTIEDKEQRYYRTKLITTYQQKHNKLHFGLYEESSHKLVSIEECPIQNKLGNRILKTINQLLVKHKIKAYNEDKQTGTIRHVVVRVGYKTQEVLVCFVIGSDVFPGINNVLKDLTKEPHIKSIYLNYNNRKSSAVFGKRFKHLYGEKTIKDSLLGYTFLIGADTFYQVNPPQAERLYQEAIKGLDLSKDEVLLDCYSGIGTITITASKYVKEAIGVEYNKQSVDLANRNKTINNINNVTFYQGDATNYILNANKTFDKLIVDPPRMGLDKAFIDAVLKLKPKKIAYVSCNPSTLSRDLSYFKEKYDIEYTIPLDMFPQTYHVESITLLSLK